MNFELQSVTSCVMGLARKLIPGWVVTVELAQSVEANKGALAMVYSTPARQMAHVVVAPHPPGESLEESIAHELTHSVLSPLTELIQRSPAAVMIEEQIVERLGKLIASAPASMARAISKALQNPRTNSPALRKRISALASRRRNEGKYKMADGSRLAELAMKAGEMGAREDVPDDVRALLAEFVAELAGGPASVDPAMAKDPVVDPAKQDGPAMREEDMPPKMRAQARGMARMHASTLDSTIRVRVHELRTVDGLVIDPAIEVRLRKATSIEDFEDRLELVKVSLGSANGQRARSKVVSEGSNVNGAPPIDSLIQEGMSATLAKSIHASFAVDAETGNLALENARKRLPAKAGAK